jgi:hypothetical protein
MDPEKAEPWVNVLDMSLTLDPDGSTISDGILQIEPKKGAGTYLHVDAFAAKYKISGKLEDGVLSLTFTQIVRQPPTIGMTLLRIVTEFSDGLMQDDGSIVGNVVFIHFLPGPRGTMGPMYKELVKVKLTTPAKPS